MQINRPPTVTQLPALVGKSKIITAIRSEIGKITDSTASVLITGPSGSGKDVVAQLLHQRSRRATRPYVALNCAAVAADLLESEMFGHEAGAFTGAVKSRAGRFEAAHGGTLFLDEVGDMALAMQAKLLRALETRVVERVGGMLPIAVDVRLVAATSVDLFAAIDRGNFRSDLLYRLDVVRIEMPSLADRVEDIPLLLQHFAIQTGAPPARFDHVSINHLMRQPWPGNVRELKNLVDRAQAHFPGEIINRDRLDRLLRPAAASPPPPLPTPPMLQPLAAGSVDLKRILNEVEAAYINAALSASGGAIAASAKLLGLQRTTLIEKMRRLHIAPAGAA
jgi:DNA-binding NtrC family response regulator